MAGVGTGGTISGTGRYLKEASDGRVRVIGADPEGSVYSGGTGRPYLVEGVGEDFWPTTYDRTICDDILAVSDADSFAMTRRLAREEGLLVGGSCGMAVVGAARVAATAGPDDVIVVLLPDGGRGYLSKIFNDKWLSDYGFVEAPGEETVGEILRAKSGDTPSLVHAHPNETVRDAIDILREYGVSQMPIVKAEPPVTAGEVVGSVSERALLEALFAGKASLADGARAAHVAEPADHRVRRAGDGGGRGAGLGGRPARARRRQAHRRHHPAGPAGASRGAVRPGTVGGEVGGRHVERGDVGRHRLAAQQRRRGPGQRRRGLDAVAALPGQPEQPVGASGSKPATGTPSATKLRRPAQAERTCRTSRVVVSLITSMARAISSSSGRASLGGCGVASAGEHSSCPASGLT